LGKFVPKFRFFGCGGIDPLSYYFMQIHMQKHSSLELEVNANAGTLSKLDEEGAEVIAEDSLYKDLVDVSVDVGAF